MVRRSSSGVSSMVRVILRLAVAFVLGVEDVLDHLVHLIVDALLEGAAGHRHDSVALVLFVHGVSPFSQVADPSVICSASVGLSA